MRNRLEGCRTEKRVEGYCGVAGEGDGSLGRAEAERNGGDTIYPGDSVD